MNQQAHNSITISSALQLALLIGILTLSGCGSIGGARSDDTGSVSSQKFLPGFIKIRWFPVDAAKAYMLYVEGEDEEVLKVEEVTPMSCTHRIIEGYTSGICVLDYKLPDVSENYLLRLSARSSSGESPRSVKSIRP